MASSRARIIHALQDGNFLAVVLLSLPSIVGTVFFLTVVIVNKVFGPEPGHDPVRPFAAADRLMPAIAALFYTCYLGAAFGPMLLVVAGQQAFVLTRAIGGRSRRVIWAWAIVALGVAAAVVSWGWLRNLDIMI